MVWIDGGSISAGEQLLRRQASPIETEPLVESPGYVGRGKSFHLLFHDLLSRYDLDFECALASIDFRAIVRVAPERWFLGDEVDDNTVALAIQD